MDRLIMTAMIVIFTLVGVKAGKVMIESTERAQVRVQCAMLKAEGKSCTTQE